MYMWGDHMMLIPYKVRGDHMYILWDQMIPIPYMGDHIIPVPYKVRGDHI